MIYFILYLGAGLYDIFQIFIYWGTDQVLFFSSLVTLIITIVLAIFHLSEPEGWHLRWVVFYTIPAFLFLIGGLSSLQEVQNKALLMIGEKPMPSLIPGTQSEYESAVWEHYISIVLPLIARIIFYSMIFFKYIRHKIIKSNSFIK